MDIRQGGFIYCCPFVQDEYGRVSRSCKCPAEAMLLKSHRRPLISARPAGVSFVNALATFLQFH